MVFISQTWMQGGHNKFQQRKYGLYKIVRKLNNNTYMVDLPTWMEISKTLNGDLTLFQLDMSLDYIIGKSRTSSLQV